MLWHAYALLSHGGDRIGLRHGRAAGRPRLRRRPDDVLRTLEGIDTAVWTANALAACAETGLIEALAQPQTLGRLSVRTGLPEDSVRILAGLLASLGFAWEEDGRVHAAPALAPFTTPDGAATFRAALRAPLLQAEAFRARAATGTLALDGWTHTDAAIIDAQGLLTRLWAERAIPKLRFLPGLTARLSAPGAALLDVGAGAAGLSIALCGAFPHLSAAALEPAPQPAAIGEARIAEAGLAARVALRRQRVEHLEDEAAFDLAFLPQMFLPDAIMPETARRVFRALRPGGWVLVAVLARRGHDVPSAISRLKNLLWGGNVRDADAVRPSLAEAGFSPIIRAPGGGAFRMLCARRPILREAS
ncbi:SAM-dependent methyltransferase [Microvirga pudoricolor]|uniref:SAM-dependent methyltransferase n=1 Tax=Microvirga pudoricolor TaxID=2778729 RepID=UPI00194E4A41|nr:class I SAM-dependent methyltransferase [Microvirga pudoricolor]MBM6593472.1 methyltransferase domain-containing protein [Microvirga pudoricolor]